MTAIQKKAKWDHRKRNLSISGVAVVFLVGLLYIPIAEHAASVQNDPRELTSKNASLSLDAPTTRTDDSFPMVSERPCWRSDCPTPRRNHIFISTNRAGFDDRLVVISRFANLAGYLCANLYVDPPHRLFHPKHNQNKPFSKDLKWSDYMHFGFGYNQTLQEVPKEFVSANDFRDASGRAPDISITTTTFNGTWETFHLLENFTSSQIQNHPPGGSSNSNSYFVWHITSWIFKMELFQKEDPLQLPTTESFPSLWIRPPENDSSCVYMEQKHLIPSNYINEIVDSVWSSFVGSHIGVLHIRRGDSSHWCNTSIARMKSFLECSFDDSTGLGNITLLLSTDETDIDYIHQVISLIHDNPSFSHIRMQWLDQMIRQRIQDVLMKRDESLERLQNNYFVYAVSKEIIKRAKFLMEQRRNRSCPDCAPIQGLLKATSKNMWQLYGH